MIQDFLQCSGKINRNEETLKVGKWMVPNPPYIEASKTLKEAAQVVGALDVDGIPVLNKTMQPISLVTTKMLLNGILQGDEEAPVTSISKENFLVVHPNDSLLDIYSLPYKYFIVTDDQNRLIGTLSINDILKGISNKINELSQTENTAEILNTILDSAYEGIVVVDRDGIIREFNEMYSRFTSIDRKDALGRHVQEVIDNTNLHNTVQTGLPERVAIQYIQGQAMIVHRIPIWKNNRCVGAIGMLVFEGVTELDRIYERLQKNTTEHSKTTPHPLKKIRQNHSITLDQIIGMSQSTSYLKHLSRKVAKTNATVLITGESGTGKEMYAQGIHNLCPFSSGPFISINCGGIPEHLFESELFGYEEGAFTGARRGGKPGKFELAQNGTLFLDEIGEMPLSMQVKLLRVLQEKEFERVGGIQKFEMNTRIIAATNRNLKGMVESGEFREDLFYRLNVIELTVAPLRERKEDIPPLISNYLNSFCQKHGMAVKTTTSEAMAALINYSWPGNTRELINTIEKLVILIDEHTIDVHHLPESITQKSLMNNEKSTSMIKHMEDMENKREKELIYSILEKTGGNKSKAAEELGIHRTTLYQKLKKYEQLK